MKTFKNYFAEDLRQWFKQKWVRMDTKGNIKGDCAREPGEGKPKCLPQAKAHALGKEGRASAARRKRREDPNPERRGAPINVKTENVDEACWTGYKQVGMKKKGSKMVPNCVPEEIETVDEKWSQKYKSSIDCNNPKGFSQRAHCQGKKKHVNEDGAAVAGPTNVVSGGAIAGTGGKGGEPGVYLPRRKKSPVVISMMKRKPPKMA